MLLFNEKEFKSYISSKIHKLTNISQFEKVLFIQAVDKYQYDNNKNILYVYTTPTTIEKLQKYHEQLLTITLKYFIDIHKINHNSIEITYIETETNTDKQQSQKQVNKNIIYSEKNIIRNDLLFENYITDETNNQAYDVAYNIANNQIKNYITPVFIFEGPTGIGKTHLVTAIANNFIEKYENKEGYFFTKDYYQSIIKKSFFEKNTSELFRKISGSDVVIFDDLAFITELPNSSYIKLIYDILDNRIRQQKPTVLTTPVPVNQMSFKFNDTNEQSAYFERRGNYFYFSKPFLSRLRSYVIKIKLPSFSLKYNYFSKKIQKQLNIYIKDQKDTIQDKVNYLISSIEADFRLVDMYTQYVIDSYLIYKDFEASLSNVLEKYFQYKDKDSRAYTRIHYLLNKISQCLNKDILALSKKKRITEPYDLMLMDLTVYVLREISNIDTKYIANIFNKDVSTISKKYTNFKKKLNSKDPEANKLYNILVNEDTIKNHNEKKWLKTCYFLTKSDITLDDYLCTVFGAINTIEGILRRLLLHHFSRNAFNTTNNSFYCFERDGKLQERFSNQMNTNAVNIVEELYDFYKQTRNNYFHNPGLSQHMLTDKQEAVELFDKIINLINKVADNKREVLKKQK